MYFFCVFVSRVYSASLQTAGQNKTCAHGAAGDAGSGGEAGELAASHDMSEEQAEKAGVVYIIDADTLADAISELLANAMTTKMAKEIPDTFGEETCDDLHSALSDNFAHCCWEGKYEESINDHMPQIKSAAKTAIANLTLADILNCKTSHKKRGFRLSQVAKGQNNDACKVTIAIDDEEIRSDEFKNNVMNRLEVRHKQKMIQKASINLLEYILSIAKQKIGEIYARASLTLAEVLFDKTRSELLPETIEIMNKKIKKKGDGSQFVYMEENIKKNKNDGDGKPASKKRPRGSKPVSSDNSHADPNSVSSSN